jgi:hypothetical protein
LSNHFQGATIRAETELKVTVVLAAGSDESAANVNVPEISLKEAQYTGTSEPLGTGHRLLP